MAEETITSGNVEETSWLMGVVNEVIYSPLNMGLIAVIGFLIYKIIKDRIEVPNAGAAKPAEVELPKLRRDFTVQELRQYDGTQPDGRVLIAVNGNVFDVTKGKRFYGPGGPYASFAGRDASRNLATFSVATNDKDDIDDLSDLSAMEMDSIREWEMQFKEKYQLVGKLLRKGEQPTNYEDEEDDVSTDATNAAANASTKDTQESDITNVSSTETEGVRLRNKSGNIETSAATATAN